MMMALGIFIFDLQTLPYQELGQQLGWRHPGTARVGLRPAHQYAGPEDETISLSGVLLPELTKGGRVSLQLLRLLADEGMAWPLIEGSGMIYGMFAIEKLTTTKTLFFQDGAARRIEFTLNLIRVGEDDLHKYGAVSSTMLNLI